MELKKGKCPLCGEEISVDYIKDADICPKCNSAYVTQKAIDLYSGAGQKKFIAKKRTVSFFKMAGSICLLLLKCIGYLIYCLSLVWLFVDLTDNFKKK